MLFDCTFMFILYFSHYRHFNCFVILRCFCYCSQCDYGLFGGGLLSLEIMYLHYFIRHSVDALLSCYVL